MKKHIDELKEKKIIVFCVGASPYEEEAVKQVIEHNLKDTLAGIPCFYCRGAWNMDMMSFRDKALCTMLRKVVAKKTPDDYEVWEKALMAAGDEACDWTEKRYIKPILECIS